MSEFLLLFPSRDKENHYRLQSLEKDGTRAGGEELEIGQIAEKSKKDRAPAILVVPAEDALLQEVEINPKEYRHAAESVPWRFENLVAEDVEKLHFAVGKLTDKKETIVAIVNKELLGKWVAPLKERDVRIHSCIPEQQLLPPVPGGWSLRLQGDNLIFLENGKKGFCFNRELAQASLSSMAGQNPPGRIVPLADDEKERGEIEKIIPQDLRPLLDAEEEWNLRAYLDDKGSNLVNFLQGAFAPKIDWEELWLTWRRLVTAAACFMLLYTGAGLAQNMVLQKRNENLEKEKEHYNALFPEMTFSTLSEINQYVAGELEKQENRKGGNNSEFLSLLSKVARGLKESKAPSLVNLDYSLERAALRVEFEVDDFPEIEDVTRALTGQGVFSRLLNSSKKKERVRAQLSCSFYPLDAGKKGGA